MDRLKYKSDMERIIEKRYCNRGDFWSGADGRIFIGNPFSTVTCTYILSDLGMEASDPIIKGACDLIFNMWKEDGRFRLAPGSSIYPCHTILVAQLMCRLGYTDDPRIVKTLNYLLETQHEDGGWRCKKFSYGRGPETEYSNPGPTLTALDAFRHTSHLNNNEKLDKAVEFLLYHWTVKKPLGPCHYGIGSLFKNLEYPFLRYNIFYYVYVLSFYNKAKNDPRFISALNFLKSKITDNRVIIETTNRKLDSLIFCKKGEYSEIASIRWKEIISNLK